MSYAEQSMRAEPPAVREAVAVFDSAEALQRAIDDLSMTGFERRELSVMAHDATIERTLGHRVGSIEEAKHDPNIPREAPVSPEDTGDLQGAAIGVPAYVGAILATGAVLATGGTALAAAVAALAAGGAGGAAGTYLGRWLSDKTREPMKQCLDKGGLLLWVNLRDPEHEVEALEILSRHSREPVEVHELPQPDPTPGGPTGA
ncbi:MAG TPA: hypothetical protein VEB64_15425 [Azospirillaceae bacterium]|nr:hypothetical protein [Azospirillaceae bacterium]